MSTHWKQNKCIILCTTCTLFLFGMIIFLYLPIGKSRNMKPGTHEHGNFSSNVVNGTLNLTDWMNRDDIETNIEDVNSDSESVISDFVKPMKLHNFSLNYEDLLYESKRNNKNKAYSVTGNFRSKSNQVWDPHPEYTLTVFGHQLHLVLHQDNSFIAPNTFRVIRILNNRTEIQEDEDHYLGCYYRGYVQGDEQSAVAVSLCNGMTGHIKTSFGSLLIQPINYSRNNENNILHKVWRHSKRHVRFLVPANLNTKINFMEEKLFSKLVRKKRNYVDKHLFTMEVLVAVDKTMSEFHTGDLKSYILTLISIVGLHVCL